MPKLIYFTLAVAVLALVASLIIPRYALTGRGGGPLPNLSLLMSINNAITTHVRIRGSFPESSAPGGGARVLATHLVGPVWISDDQMQTEDGKHFEPFFSPERKWLALDGDRPVAIVDTRGQPVLYYSRTRPVPEPDAALEGPLWGPDGVFDSDHNARVPRLTDELIREAGGERADFILVIAGQDGVWGTDDDYCHVGDFD